ncbi:MAG: aminotransferase class III-fold pyridoxal phosphate-dependent enzyme [Rhodospirillales bacterium]
MTKRSKPQLHRLNAHSPITGTGQDLYARARNIIPGGTQLLSKRPELFLPDQWPAYYQRAQGAEVWDLDGRRYLDFTHCGVGTSALGFADPDVNAAVIRALEAGTMGTLNCPEEVELAELLIELHPWAEMVRYARTGGEVLAMAVRIARAATGRDQVAFCGYHGWSDWYLAANIADHGNLDSHLLPGLSPAGVPGALRGTTLPFHYNDIDELRRIVSANGSRLAAIVMEPCRTAQPEPGFLEAVRAIANSCGAVLIFDEITSGWRMTTGGIHLTMGVTPDLAAFAKCMSNGYPMAAVIGTRAVMDAAQGSFISSSYWTERVGPAAALATIRKHISLKLPRHLIAAGDRIQEGWRTAAAAVGLNITVSGIPPLSTFVLDQDESAPLMTLFTQEMLARGYLAGGQVYTMLAHTDDLIDAYLENVGEVFGFVAAAVQAGNIAERLNGPVKYDGFHRLA